MTTREETQEQLLTAMAAHVPFDGWTKVALRAAANDLDISYSQAQLLLPGGPGDYVYSYHQMMDRKLEKRLAELDLSTMKIREKIATGVRERLMLGVEEKAVIRKGLAVMSMPQNGSLALKALKQTLDIIWYAAGDNATDWNYYSKRMLLASVYSSTLLYWLEDKSEGHVQTWAFLGRRIDDVMKIPKVKGKITKIANRFSALPQLRRKALARFKARI